VAAGPSWSYHFLVALLLKVVKSYRIRLFIPSTDKAVGPYKTDLISSCSTNELFNEP
jgi:hypothetical protein